jgi:four helix bundle protein
MPCRSGEPSRIFEAPEMFSLMLRKVPLGSRHLPRMGVKSAKELTVYKKAYQLAMRIYEVSKRFPPEERFALVSQIRRSSRSVSMNLREAWAKRFYLAQFVNKLTDCDAENSETDTSLDFARDCGLLTPAP